MVLFVLVLIFFQVSPLYADEIALTGPQSLNEMDEYIQEEEGRIRSIKLLSLDLEKSNIELKQREVQVKMAQLNKDGVFTQASLLGPGLNQLNVVKRLIALTVTASFKEAVIDFNGVSTTVHEGDAVIDGKVEQISKDGVTIVNQDGKNEVLSLIL